MALQEYGMKKLEKMLRELNDSFSDELHRDFKKKFSIEIETHFNLMCLNMITKRVDEEDFTVEQKEFISAYETGYMSAMNVVTRRINEEQ